jgi:hypothetical protein
VVVLKKHIVLLTGLPKAGLEKVKVSERKTYQSNELELFIKSSDGLSFFPALENEKEFELYKVVRRVAKKNLRAKWRVLRFLLISLLSEIFKNKKSLNSRTGQYSQD